MFFFSFQNICPIFHLPLSQGANNSRHTDRAIKNVRAIPVNQLVCSKSVSLPLLKFYMQWVLLLAEQNFVINNTKYSLFFKRDFIRDFNNKWFNGIHDDQWSCLVVSQNIENPGVHRILGGPLPFKRLLLAADTYSTGSAKVKIWTCKASKEFRRVHYLSLLEAAVALSEVHYGQQRHLPTWAEILWRLECAKEIILHWKGRPLQRIRWALRRGHLRNIWALPNRFPAFQRRTVAKVH